MYYSKFAFGLLILRIIYSQYIIKASSVGLLSTDGACFIETAIDKSIVNVLNKVTLTV